MLFLFVDASSHIGPVDHRQWLCLLYNPSPSPTPNPANVLGRPTKGALNTLGMVVVIMCYFIRQDESSLHIPYHPYRCVNDPLDGEVGDVGKKMVIN